MPSLAKVLRGARDEEGLPLWDVRQRWILGEWADGRWVRDLVADVADRGIPGISEIEQGSEEGRDLRECRADFLAAFAAIAADAKIGRAARSAVWEAILDALLIGCTIGSRELSARLQKNFKQARAATARRGKTAKREERLVVVRGVMEETPKASKGVGYARRIEAKVNKRLAREADDKVSEWTRHCHINRFYCSLLASPLDSDSIESMA